MDNPLILQEKVLKKFLQKDYEGYFSEDNDDAIISRLFEEIAEKSTKFITKFII